MNATERASKVLKQLSEGSADKPYTLELHVWAHAIAEAEKAALLAERERCAGIAETWGGPPNPGGRRAALAAAIRSGVSA